MTIYLKYNCIYTQYKYIMFKYIYKYSNQKMLHLQKCNICNSFYRYKLLSFT